MSKITLAFMQRYQGKLNTAIKEYVSKINVNDKGSAIPTGTDLDTLTNIGVYYIADDTIAGNIVHLPLAVSGKVMVADNGNNGLVQLYIPNHAPRIFQRIYWSNAWSAWIEYDRKPKQVSGTLEAGETSITFTSADITATSMLDIYTHPATPYVSISGEVGSATVTFEEQEEDVTVVLEIKEQ